MDRNIPSLTGLRFWAAGFVLWAHGISVYAARLDGHPLNDTQTIARLGMTLFFVLSGFVIHYNYGHRLATWHPAAIGQFLVARFARLYPLYAFCLFLELWAVYPNFPSEEGSRRALIYYLFLAQDWWPFTVDGKIVGTFYLGAAWSISAEVALYLFYVPLAPVLTKLRGRSALLALLVLVVVMTALTATRASLLWGTKGDGYWLYYLNPFCRLPEFLLGSLIAAVVNGKIEITATEKLALQSFAAVGIIAATVLFAGTQSVASNWFNLFTSSWGYAPSCGAVILFLCLVRSDYDPLVQSGPVLLLGEASYSLYLLSGYALGPFNHGDGDKPIAMAIRLIFWLAILMFLSVGCYRLYERPARIIVRRAFATLQRSHLQS